MQYEDEERIHEDEDTYYYYIDQNLYYNFDKYKKNKYLSQIINKKWKNKYRKVNYEYKLHKNAPNKINKQDPQYTENVTTNSTSNEFLNDEFYGDLNIDSEYESKYESESNSQDVNKINE